MKASKGFSFYQKNYVIKLYNSMKSCHGSSFSCDNIVNKLVSWFTSVENTSNMFQVLWNLCASFNFVKVKALAKIYVLLQLHNKLSA